MSVKLVFLAFLLHLGCALAHPYGYNVCFEPLYQKLAPLSDYPPALSFCSQRYPRPPCTVTKRPTAVSTKVVTIPVTNTATVTTGYSTDIVYTATAISYIYTSTVVKTTTTSTSTATRYTSTSIQTVYTHSSFPVAYTSTATEYTVTGTDTITVPIATLPTTVTTTTVSTTSTVKTTTTVSSGTKTVTTHVDHGLRKRTAHPAQPSTTDPSSDPGKRSYGYPTKRDLFNRLKGLNRNKLQNACSCLKPKKVCKTVTAAATSVTTSYKTIKTTVTSNVGGVVTDDEVFISRVSTETTTTTSIGYTTTLELVEIDTTSLEYVSTISTVTTTTLPTNAVTSTSITSYSTTNVAFTTTLFTTSTASTTVPVTTTTVAISNQYSLVYGPANGCAYLPNNWIDQTSRNIPSSSTHADRVAICAQYCDSIPGCKTFGMNWFPPCQGNGDSVYCLASGDAWSSGKVQCGIGTGWNGCSIYQDGTIYQKS